MKVGIIGAMKEEVTLLCQKIQSCQTLTRAGCSIYSGFLGETNVVLLQSGIGKTSAALGATLLLEYFQPDILINTGSAAGLWPGLKIGDIVISTEVRYHDVNVTAFGYEWGQMALCPPAFFADKKLIEIVLECVKNLNLNAVQGLICSGDAFINGDQALDRIRTFFPKAVAVEMEAAAIAQVCHQFETPFVVIRAISDVADQASHLSFEQFLCIAAQRSSTVIENMLPILAETYCGIN